MTHSEIIATADKTEDRVLEHLGYQPELKRSFGPWGIVGFSFSIVTCWSALGGVLVTGVNAGGPPVMIWGWLGVSLASLCVAYSMAEMCSEYPVAGGQYSWVYLLAPKSFRRQLSYLTGWFMVIGILAMGATNSFIGANFILGQANLLNPNYTIQRWHTVLLAYLLTISATFTNLWGAAILDRASKGLLVFNMVAFVATIVTILAWNTDKQPASFVFQDFQNSTGFGTAMAGIIGILQPAFDDAPAHMCEELKDSSIQAPRAMVLSVYVGAVTGFIFLISVCFCIGDINAIAQTSTLVPLIQIYFDSTKSTVAACTLASMISIINLGAANALLAEGARCLYALARDAGLPFSSQISIIEQKHQTPIVAILLGTIVQMLFNSIYFGTVTGFNTVIAIATQGFYLSYAMPLLVRILAFFQGTHRKFTGPWAMKPSVSLAVNIVGLTYLLFACISFNFPSRYPVSVSNMNYVPAAIGVILFIALMNWQITGKKQFTGPRLKGIDEGLLILGGESGSCNQEKTNQSIGTQA
ncbi:Bgt-4679 [Blumeria graminis f. sp. tritici]|uniref:Bgt-4679 n=2 Tax=Blumeria graminis f. sp. tritici TaxID=62690 RepID=A0A9X9QFX3_BLUGR|nr:Choline-ethanolamine transporter [Blumeria graminis f. sp. tritici 96224]VDB93363.1 Bgt-4679 [Blumeria graminis f. sp. tritici]